MPLGPLPPGGVISVKSVTFFQMGIAAVFIAESAHQGQFYGVFMNRLLPQMQAFAPISARLSRPLPETPRTDTLTHDKGTR